MVFYSFEFGERTIRTILILAYHWGVATSTKSSGGQGTASEWECVEDNSPVVQIS